MTRPCRSLALATSVLLLTAAAGVPEVRGQTDVQSQQRLEASGPTTLFQRSQAVAQSEYRAAPARVERPGRAMPLTKQEQIIRRAQAALIQLGYDLGEVDGKLGPRTKAAIAAFQRDRGAPADGRLTHRLLGRLAVALTDARTVERTVATGEAPADEPQATEPQVAEPRVAAVATAEEPVASEEPGGRDAGDGEAGALRLIAPAEAATGAPGAREPESAPPEGPTDYSYGAAARELWHITSGLMGYLVEAAGERALDRVR